LPVPPTAALACAALRRTLAAIMPVAALVLVVLAAAYRLLAVHEPAFLNLAPLMALAFCSAVYARDRRWWAAPFLALALSDLYLNHHYASVYGDTWKIGSILVNFACYAAALGLGALVATRRSWLNLFSGALGGSVLFYLATNTAAWAGDPFYVKNAAGWWQALTVGRPEFPPTLWFFRNTLVGDLLFTGVLALALEWNERRAGRPSLLGGIAVAPLVAPVSNAAPDRG
jgi:hypothetical protein